MDNKKSRKKPAFSDAELVAYCGINCKDCKARSEQRLQLAKLFKESLQELPLDIFRETFPAFKNIDQVMEFLEFLPQLGGMQTCCTSTSEPCGDPNCEIRACVKNSGYRTCAECAAYRNCARLDFLKPHHPTLLADLDFIEKNGFNQYVTEIIAKQKVKPIIIE
ncbi:MAG: DUF3795 domain-containing protein [Candidatus Bathyarchaeales archaeon]